MFKKIIKIGAVTVLFLFALFLFIFVIYPRYLSGGIFNVGIGIIDTSTGEMVFVKSDRFREVVVLIDESQKKFYTLRKIKEWQRPQQQKDGEVEMRTINTDGEVIDTKQFPIFLDGYAGKTDYAFSPDSKKFLFYSFEDKSLNLHQFDTKSNANLISNVSSSGYSIKFIEWISDKQFIIALSDDEKSGRLANEIVLYDIDARKKSTLYNPTYLSSSYNHKLSKSGRYLAFGDGAEEYSSYENIKVLNVQTGNIVYTVPHSGRTLFFDVDWSPNEDKLVYIMNNTIFTYSLQDQEEGVIKKFSTDKSVSSVFFLDQNRIVYRVRDRVKDRGKSFLHTISLDKKNENQLIEAAFNGDLYIVDQGRYIICELGY